MTLTVTSSAFAEGGDIPSLYTCDGKDVSPPLAWEGAPEATRSLVIICDDPDAPAGTWVHWVLYDLPPDVTALDASVPARSTLENGARHGANSWHRRNYGGPCPPSGTHRYYFKVYALDTRLGLSPGQTKAEVVAAMEGHVLAEGQLMGRYHRH